MKQLLAICLAVTVFAISYGQEEPEKKKQDIQPTIPIDVADPTLDWWKMIRDDLSEGREPGPIDVQRQPFGLAWQGIPTFFRLPVALVPEDLKAGQVDVAIMGAHTDMGLGSRGANRGASCLSGSQG